MYPVQGLAYFHRISHGPQSPFPGQLVVIAQPLQVPHMVLIMRLQLLPDGLSVRQEPDTVQDLCDPSLKAFSQSAHLPGK